MRLVIYIIFTVMSSQDTQSNIVSGEKKHKMRQYFICYFPKLPLFIEHHWMQRHFWLYNTQYDGETSVCTSVVVTRK
ncbi:hypothetical protein E2C01_033677 [Portunus trituberculatus]|uniref:Uncharacterized protein n=1 Tax=Portunus trituberculatus TaxID=210409 RepID=A0A5B7F0R5_PORTR|nr:hypothetical protein [Portunus trituberculatus]